MTVLLGWSHCLMVLFTEIDLKHYFYSKDPILTFRALRGVAGRLLEFYRSAEFWTIALFNLLHNVL